MVEKLKSLATDYETGNGHFEHEPTSNNAATISGKRRPRIERPARLFVFLAAMAVLGFLYARQQFVDTSLPFWHCKSSTEIDSSVEVSTPIRKVIQHETSQSIQGTYNLYDLLDLSTSSGSIDITIDVHSGERPAAVRLSSMSGSIAAYYRLPVLSTDQHDVHKREFQTEIKSGAGHVDVDSLLHGNGGWTRIETSAGSIDADIVALGVGADDKLSRITTRSSSGSQNIRISSAFDESRSNLTSLRAEHHSTGSASLDVVYPAQWDGLVHASCGGSGHVNVKGNKLQYGQHGQREVYAWRGDVDEDSIPSVEVRVDGSASIIFRC